MSERKLTLLPSFADDNSPSPTPSAAQSAGPMKLPDRDLKDLWDDQPAEESIAGKTLTLGAGSSQVPESAMQVIDPRTASDRKLTEQLGCYSTSFDLYDDACMKSCLVRDRCIVAMANQIPKAQERRGRRNQLTDMDLVDELNATSVEAVQLARNVLGLRRKKMVQNPEGIVYPRYLNGYEDPSIKTPSQAVAKFLDEPAPAPPEDVQKLMDDGVVETAPPDDVDDFNFGVPLSTKVEELTPAPPKPKPKAKKKAPAKKKAKAKAKPKAKKAAPKKAPAKKAEAAPVLVPQEVDPVRYAGERRKSPKVDKLTPGTVMERTYKGNTYVVEVMDDHYVLNGVVFPTLYAATCAIAGDAFSTPRFWKLPK